MSAEAPTTPAAVEATPAVVEVRPKNAHRLNRILRKLKASLPPRKWSVEEEGATRTVGVPAGIVRQLIEGLTEEEKQRAAAGLDPMSATQEALVRRAARFGLDIHSTTVPIPVAPVPTFAVDEETLRRREERFKQAAPQ